MGRIARKFKVASVAILFALSLLAGAAVTAQAQSWPDPYYGRTSKEQRKWEKEQEKRRRKEQKEWEKRERKREKEARKARERRERDGYYDGRDYEYDRYGRRDRDYEYGRGGDAELRRAAYERGARDGLRAGSSDRANGHGYDYDDHQAYRNAGYNDRYGRSGEYEDSYREGFRRGYDEGYRRGDTYRRRDTGWGRILGDILRRP